MRAVSLGYLTAGASAALRPGHWDVRVAGEPVLDDVPPAGWDYHTPVQIHRRVDVDLPALLADVGLAPGSRLVATIHWTAPSTGLRGTTAVQSLVDGTNEFSAEIAGSDLSGRVRFEFRVLMAERAADSSPLSATRPYSTLWSDQHAVLLDSTGARLPTAAVSFTDTGIGGGHRSAWYLEMRTADLTANAAGAIRLWLNTDHPRIRQLLDEPDSETGRILTSAMEFDVARRLITEAISSEEFSPDVDTDPGTLGRAMTGLTAIFDENWQTVRAWSVTDPSILEARLQSALNSYGDVP